MFISSDTNIWIDFLEIGHPEHPFLLKYEYYLSTAAYDDELIRPEGLREMLSRCGLRLTGISEAEFELAALYREKYGRISLYDAIALAIAKTRAWILLTGDKPLRIAAERERVDCHGVIWIYDELRRQNKISASAFSEAIRALKMAVEEGKCRLPLHELDRRLSGCGTSGAEQ